MNIEGLLSPAEIVEKYGRKLGIKSTKTLWQWRRRGLLPFVRIGKVVRHTDEHISTLLRNLERLKV